MFKQGEMMAASLNKIYGKIGAVTLEIYSTFYHNNYGNYNFLADWQCDHYVFYINGSIQFCMISGQTLSVKADFLSRLEAWLKSALAFHIF